jgi:hypothetical protein
LVVAAVSGGDVDDGGFEFVKVEGGVVQSLDGLLHVLRIVVVVSKLNNVLVELASELDGHFHELVWEFSVVLGKVECVHISTEDGDDSVVLNAQSSVVDSVENGVADVLYGVVWDKFGVPDLVLVFFVWEFDGIAGISAWCGTGVLADFSGESGVGPVITLGDGGLESVSSLVDVPDGIVLGRYIDNNGGCGCG